MNFKTPFKVLTTAALIGTLSLSAVAPGAASATEKTVKTVQTKAELAVSHIVLEDAKGNLITLDYNTYLEAKSVGIDLGAEPVSIKVGDKFYNLNDFLEAKSVSNNNLEEAVKLLDKNDLSQDINPAEGTIEDGKLVVAPGEEDFKVTEIAAINATVDTATKGQKLSFTVNGEAADLEKLAENGYTVKFVATKDVFKDAKTGELKDTLADGTFSYQVEVSKEGEETKTSNEAKVTVADLSQVVASLDSYKTSVESGTVLVDGSIDITEIAGKTAKDADIKFTASLNDKFTFKSSNTSVALVSSTGKVTGVTAGEATITATLKDNEDVKIEIPVKVATEEPAVASFVVDPASVGVVVGKSQTLKATVKDQYGDAKDLDAVSNAEVKNADGETIAKLSIANGSKTGEQTVTVTGVKAGTGEYAVKVGEKTIATIAVKIGDAGEVSARKLELATGSKTLDLNPTKTATTATFYFNQYNADDLKIDAEKEIGLADANKTYTVASSDKTVADVAVDAEGKITVTGVKAGKATITVKEGGITRASEEITVENSSPSVTDVKFEDVKVSNLSTDVSKLLKASGITLSSASDVKIAGGKIFIDGTTGQAGEFDGNDIKLAEYKVVNAETGFATLTSDKVVINPEVAKEGQFNLVVTTDEKTYTQTFDVDVKAEVAQNEKNAAAGTVTIIKKADADNVTKLTGAATALSELTVAQDGTTIKVTGTGTKVTEFNGFWGSANANDDGIYFGIKFNLPTGVANFDSAKIISFNADGTEKAEESFDGVFVQQIHTGNDKNSAAKGKRVVKIAWDGTTYKEYTIDFSAVTEAQ